MNRRSYFFILFVLSCLPARAQKCQASITNGPLAGSITAPRSFEIKLPRAIPRYGDLIRVSVDTSGQPDGIETYTPNPFTNTHVATLADGANSAQAFINSQCPDGYTFGASAARPHASPSPKAGFAAGNPNFGQALNGITGGDFNGDGVLDYAEADNSSISVTLYNADNSTLSTAIYALPSTTEAGLVAADFNGDGVLDLAVLQDPVAGATVGSIALLLGKGDGTFGAATTVVTGVASGVLVVADFNGDGKLDLGVDGGNQFAALLGRGDGTFGAPLLTTIAVGASAVAADVTGDGKVDLILSGGDEVDVYPSNGDGTFKSQIQSPTGGISGAFIYLAYADLNHDGKLDYIIANGANSGLYVGFGNGDGTFQTPQVYTVPSNVGSIGVIPLGDGNTAMVMGDSFSSSLIYFFASSTGELGLPQEQILAAASIEYQPAVSTADLNGDKKADLVLTLASGIAVELGNGNGTFASPVAYATSGLPGATAILDLNGDGKPDLVVTNPTGANVFLNNGDGTFRAGTSLTGTTWAGVTVADFNGDGRLDLGVMSTAPGYTGLTSSTFEVLPSKGDGTFLAPLPTTVAGPGAIAFTADFNGDGKLDLVAGYTDDEEFHSFAAFYPGNGDGTFGTAVALPVTATIIGTGDLNGDGKPDLVTSSFDTDVVEILLGNGDGTFQPPVMIGEGFASSGIIADLNGDGKPDLILGACCGVVEASYLLGDGEGTFGPQTFFPSGPNPSSIVVADFDGSGKASLAIAGQFGYGADTPTLTVVKTSFPLAAAVVSSAYPQVTGIAPGMLATAYATDLASSSGPTPLPLPLAFEGTSVSITDSAGATTAAPLLYISPGQVNFEVPAGVALGSAEVDITSGDGTLSSDNVTVSAVVPGVFALDAAGLAAADVLTVSGTAQTYGSVYTVTASGALAPNPVSLGAAGTQVFLILYGTGFQAAGTGGVTVSIGGVNATVAYAGSQGSLAGLDQANVLIPASLAGKGQVTIQLTANGVPANPVNVTIQ